MKKGVLFFLLLFSLIIISCKKDSEPTTLILTPDLNDSQISIINELNLYIKSFNGSAISNDDNDLKVFDRFADALVIGLGEDTHGTKEFFQMKHRLFKYFVEKHGFRIFGFEADMAECIYIDRFICDNAGTIDFVMSKMHFWTWKTQEVKELILWMKQYNQSKPQNEKIHLLGVDCQIKDMNKALIIEYLQKYAPQYPGYIDRILSNIDVMVSNDFAAMTEAKINLLKTQCDSVKTYFENNYAQLSAASGNFEFNIIKQLTIQTKQYIDVTTTTSFNYRDKYMAENTIWLTGLFGQNTKVVSWAHNAHVANNPIYSGSGSQGSYLRSDLSNKYKIIGFSFNYGTFRAVGYDVKNKSYTGLALQSISQTPPAESYNFIFSFTKPQDFILFNSDIPRNSQLYAWYNSSRKFLSIGASYTPSYFNEYFGFTNLLTSFDAVIHFHNTNTAVAY